MLFAIWAIPIKNGETVEIEDDREHELFILFEVVSHTVNIKALRSEATKQSSNKPPAGVFGCCILGWVTYDMWVLILWSKAFLVLILMTKAIFCFDTNGKCFLAAAIGHDTESSLPLGPL